MPEWSALEYGRLGWLAFPGRARGKEPATRRGLYDATKDPSKLREMFRDPSLNTAVRTGAESGVLVLDMDGDPRELLGDRTLPRTPTQRTGGGGWQCFYRWPEGLEAVSTTRVGLLPGVDTRGRGGYCIVPPSVHPNGRRYAWARGLSPRDLPLAPPPAWLIDLLKPPTTSRRREVPMQPPGQLNDRYIARAVEAECMAVATAPEGHRNDQLNRSAFALARFVASGDAALDPIVSALATAAACAGLSAREIEATLASAFRSRMVSI